ncbi:hypothetical protein NTJ89_001071, partial [Enterococcus hirae]|nr:hypothetical protein [Enterococcus hirae]
MNKELASILDEVKKMPLIEGQWKENNRDIEDEKFAFYKLKDNRNFLFHYFDNLFEEDTNKNITESAIAEHIVREAEKYLEKYYGDYVPQDTYVVFLSKVSKHVGELQKFIIRIEENEFLFKKYVC